MTSNATTATITGLASNRTYYFDVKAVNAGAASLASNEAVAHPRVVWIPDFWGQLVQVRIGGGATTTAITLKLPNCNPNSTTINKARLYVACCAFARIRTRSWFTTPPSSRPPLREPVEADALHEITGAGPRRKTTSMNHRFAHFSLHGEKSIKKPANFGFGLKRSINKNKFGKTRR